jgi:hypothetical protein
VVETSKAIGTILSVICQSLLLVNYELQLRIGLSWRQGQSALDAEAVSLMASARLARLYVCRAGRRSELLGCSTDAALTDQHTLATKSSGRRCFGGGSGSFEIAVAHAAMVRGRMMLGEVIGQVIATAAPVYQELALLDTVFDPIEAHIHGLGAFVLDGVIGNAGSTGIVGLDRRWWLLMAKCFQGVAVNRSIFGIVEDTSKLSNVIK